MSNRTLFFLTALIGVGLITLLVINMTSLLTGQPPNQSYLKYNDIRGMAISHGQTLYTLNFQQQNRIADILNRAVPIDEIKTGKRQPSNIDQLIIYQFENQPDIVLTAIAYVDNDLIFAAKQWVPNGYLMELSEGDLKTLLSQTFD